MERLQIGDVLDGLGVLQDLDDGDLITDAVVVTKVVTAEGKVQLGIANSEGISWIDQLGMLTAAVQTMGPGDFESRDD